MTSAYVFDRSEGYVHIRLAANPKTCIACVRADAYDIIAAEQYTQGWEAAKRAAIEAVGRGAGQ